MSVAVANPVEEQKKYFAKKTADALRRYEEHTQDPSRNNPDDVDRILAAAGKTPAEMFDAIDRNAKRKARCDKSGRLKSVKHALEEACSQLEAERNNLARVCEPIQQQIDLLEADTARLRDEYNEIGRLRESLIEQAIEEHDWLRSEVNSVKRAIADCETEARCSPLPTSVEFADIRFIEGEWVLTNEGGLNAENKAKEFASFMAKVNAHKSRVVVLERELVTLRARHAQLNDLAASPFPEPGALEKLDDEQRHDAD